MKAYSIDLRQKIRETYEKERISQRKLAARFRVALSFIAKLLKQYRETGEIGPQPNRGGVKLKFNPEQLALLGELIEPKNDATLEELCQLMMEKTGVKVSVATMGRMTKRLNLTVKKTTMYAGEKGS